METYLEQSRRWVPAQPSCLSAVQGRVWLTQDGDLDDHLLLPGQSMHLSAGRGVTLGPWQPDEAVRLRVCAAPASRLSQWRALGLARSLQAVADGAQAVARWARSAAQRQGPLGDLGDLGA